MEIKKATEEHIDYISDSLSKYFTEANIFFGYPRFKEDYDLMFKYVSQRIKDGNSKFSYFIALDDTEKPLGFINLLHNGDNVGSILVAISDQEEVIESLVKYAMEFFKNKGLTNIQSEYFEYQESLGKILSGLGIKKEMTSLRIDI
jgi:hypothetical protein